MNGRLRKRRRGCLLGVTLICLTSSGCNALFPAPRTRTETVIVGVGEPIQILETVTVRGQRLRSEVVVEQGIGGWVAMPLEHFEALKRAAERDSDAFIIR